MKSWKKTAEEILTLGPVVPVIVIERLEDAVPLAKALIAGGVKVLEVTLRTECALDAIKKIIKEVPEAVVGAGTVTTVEQLKQATEAGVEFIITPGITDSILKAAVEGTVPVIPGIATISELKVIWLKSLKWPKKRLPVLNNTFPPTLVGGLF